MGHGTAKFMLGITIVILAIVALVSTGAALSTPGATPASRILDVHGNIKSVAAESQAHGWPHPPTAKEMADTASLVGWALAGRNVAWSSLCKFGQTMARVKCDLLIGGSGGRHWTVKLRIWEDGSYRFTYVMPRNAAA